MRLSEPQKAHRSFLIAIIRYIEPQHSAAVYDLMMSSLIDAAAIRFNKLLTICVECNHLYYKRDTRQMFCSLRCAGKVNANIRPRIAETGEASAAIDPANDPAKDKEEKKTMPI